MYQNTEMGDWVHIHANVAQTSPPTEAGWIAHRGAQVLTRYSSCICTRKAWGQGVLGGLHGPYLSLPFGVLTGRAPGPPRSQMEPLGLSQVVPTDGPACQASAQAQPRPQTERQRQRERERRQDYNIVFLNGTNQVSILQETLQTRA